MKVDFAKYYAPKPKQLEAHGNRAKFLLFGGAMGSGKSYFLCGEAVRNAMQFAGNRLVIVRKETSVIKRTILITFFQICPPEIILNFNQSSLTVTFINGSQLLFMEANVSKDPNLNKIKGLEIGWFGIDEANEVGREVYNVLKSRLRWVLPDGSLPRYEGRLTSNPENCWLIPVFIQARSSFEIYVQALTADNYDPSSEYYKTLEDAFKDSPALLQRYLYGDWSLVDSINQLIPNQAIQNSSPFVQGEHFSLGVDVARYGDDRTAFVLMQGGNIEKTETYPQTSLTHVAQKIVEFIEHYDISHESVGIDGVGLGAGVIDILRKDGYDITEIIGGQRVEEDDSEEEAFKPFNLRAKMYYQLRQDILNGELGNLTDQSLKHELSLIQYEISAEKSVKIIPKDSIKKLNGKSPDLADALCYANWVRNLEPAFYGGLPICGGL